MDVKIVEHICGLLWEKILSIDRVTGGDINESYKLKTRTNSYFVKYNKSYDHKGIISSEIEGLTLLKAKGLRTPEVSHHFSHDGYSGIIMEWIDSASNFDSLSQRDLGVQLAILHNVSNTHFGNIDNNYIGTLTQYNNWYKNFTDYYLESRLFPQYESARKNRYLSSPKNIENILSKICQLIPKEEPTLIHGDLWSGNYIINRFGKSYLIDPSVSYGHREMDVAMLHLFGRPDDAVIETYNLKMPLQKGWEQRMEIFQLYYLLVHLNIFGSIYESRVTNIINKYK